jgi:hypothetical protein
MAEVEKVGFVAALSAAQQHVGFWDCYHGFGVLSCQSAAHEQYVDGRRR